MRRTLPLLVLCSLATLAAAEPNRVTFDEADARLRRAHALAQETNDPALIERVLGFRDAVRKAFTRRDPAGAERLVRDAEQAVGLDPGGQTMLGLPVTHMGAGQRKEYDALQDRLAAAMKKEDRVAVAMVIADVTKLLGDQAGLPDIRQNGDDDKATPVNPEVIADLFVKAIEADPRALRALSSGKPDPATLPRSYAAIVQGCLIARPLVARHRDKKLEVVDGLARGCCQAMVALQLSPGFFKFPDVRGKHVRYGEMIDSLVDRDAEAVRDGWVVVPDPDGMAQLDAGECGIALLRAGAAYTNADWTKAGRTAADWSLGQPCVPTFHYSAATISLLCEAFRATGDRKYLDQARQKYQFGVGPGQLPVGRWANPLSARSAAHLVLIRAVHDLEEVLPAGKERDDLADGCRRAVKSLLDEADKLGAPATALTVQELGRQLRTHPSADPRLRGVVEQAAAAVVQKASGRARATVPLPELAATGRTWEK